MRRVSLRVSLRSESSVPGQVVVVYVISFVVETTVPTDLVMTGVIGTVIVVRLVSTVVFVRVTGTVKIVDPFVMTVEVTGQVVVLSNSVSIYFELLRGNWIALKGSLTLCRLCLL